jgi:AcrR family transcriptional regulator
MSEIGGVHVSTTDPVRQPVSPRGQRTRAALLRAAREAFEQQGFAEVNVAAIAKRAGVGYGSFYAYFTSLDDIFIAVADQFFSDVHHLSRAPAGVTDPIARVTEENKRFFRLYRQNARMFQLVEERAAVDDKFRNTWQVLRDQYVHRMTRNLRRLEEQGVIEEGLDLAYTAEVLSAMVERAAHLSALQPRQDDKRLLQALENTWSRVLGYGPAVSD